MPPATSGRRVPRRGEIWSVAVPGDPHAPRPFLVVSDPLVHAFWGDFLMIPLWTSAPAGPTRVPIRAREGGIQHDSVLLCDQITRIPRGFVRGDRPIGGPVPVSIMKAVMKAVLITLGDPSASRYPF